jgi:hypothetical protein
MTVLVAPPHTISFRVTVGAYDQKVDGVGLHICLEHLSDRTALYLNRFEGGLDSVFGEMADKGCPGFRRIIQIVVTFGLTKMSSSTAIAVTRAPISPATATHCRSPRSRPHSVRRQAATGYP